MNGRAAYAKAAPALRGRPRSAAEDVPVGADEPVVDQSSRDEVAHEPSLTQASSDPLTDAAALRAFVY